MDLSSSVQYLPEIQNHDTVPVEEDWLTYLTNPGYTLVAGMICGLAVNILNRHIPRPSAQALTRPLFVMPGNSKMVLIVRTDLGMTKGKAAAQCAHAALGCYKKALKNAPEALAAWEKTGQAKVCLKIESEESLLTLAGKAKELGLTWSIVRDAGRTQVEAGSMTVLGIGPAGVDQIDTVTGHLKLY